jgi:hypothetical protein
MLTLKQKDALERILWTTAQVAIPTIAVYVAKLPPEWIPVGTIALAVIKNLVAAHYQPTQKEPS